MFNKRNSIVMGMKTLFKKGEWHNNNKKNQERLNK